MNFTGWAGYPALAEKVFPAFTAATGIKVNFTEQPDQDAMLAAAKVSIEAGGIDMIEPTIDTVAAWGANGLLGAWDPAKLGAPSADHAATAAVAVGLALRKVADR